MHVLVACECSGVVREAFNARAGVRAVSCDLKPAEDGRDDVHIRGDVLDLLDGAHHWDLVIAHPPCTRLAVSGAHLFKRYRKEQEYALRFARAIYTAPVPRLCLENPVSIISTRICKPTQIIQPYNFGEDASKKTCLWLRGLPPLEWTQYVPPRWANGKPRWSNQTDSGQNRLGPSPDRAANRARTYPRIAEAMADQWTKHFFSNRT